MAAASKRASTSGKGVIRSDWLEVQSKVLRLWERRFVVLTDVSICMYKPSTQTATDPGVLAVELRLDSIVNVLGPAEADFRLRLELGPFVGYNIKCFTSQRASDWKRDVVYRACKKDK